MGCVLQKSTGVENFTIILGKDGNLNLCLWMKMMMRKERDMSTFKSNLEPGAVFRNRLGKAMFAYNENELAGTTPHPQLESEPTWGQLIAYLVDI